MVSISTPNMTDSGFCGAKLETRGDWLEDKEEINKNIYFVNLIKISLPRRTKMTKYQI